MHSRWRFPNLLRSNSSVTIAVHRICAESTSTGDPGPLLLEEPELSLHPEIVRYLPQMFARVQRRTGRQLILSTHSSDLLRDEGIGLDEVLLLRPGTEGTQIQPASAFAEIGILLQK